MITRTTVLDQLRETAGIDLIELDDELFDLGIDSVRLMRLTDAWRQERPHLDFAEIAGARTIADLLAILDAT